jgi:prepilin-type N-terminal cleavage/methylation domain-containing protein
MPTFKKIPNAFTLVELLIVISIVGILSGITLSIINASAQRSRATDGVKLSTLSKLVEALETHRVVEGRYPIVGGSGVPAMTTLQTYLTKWPNNEPEGAYYEYFSDGAGTLFGLTVETSLGTVYKYRSSWGQIRHCVSVSPNNDTCTLAN